VAVNTAEPTTDTSQSFAIPGLTRAQLLNGVLGVRVRASRGNSNAAFTASLDAVSVRVDYTAPQNQAITVNVVGATTARGADTFTYDQANRLTSATVAGVTETYTYDGDGVRFARQVGAGSVTRYVSDINTGLPVTIDDGVRKYVWGQGLAYAVSGTTLEVYHTDRLGSVRAITDAAGAVTATYRTDEFGIPTATTSTSSQPFAFTGEPRDGTGLSYLRARYYEPSLGRFLSRDTWPGHVRPERLPRRMRNGGQAERPVPDAR
jgi:RHS repeat-associated protein